MIVTLQDSRTRPFTSRIPLHDLPLRRVMARQCELYPVLKDDRPRPDYDAMWFYTTNHAMSELAKKFGPDQPLSPEASELVLDYHADNHGRALRAFHYLLLICNREIRHLGTPFSWKLEQDVLMLSHLRDVRAESSHDVTNMLRTSPPDVSLGRFVDYLVLVFDSGEWADGYGGKAWASIAKALRSFVRGFYSAEILLDTVFTLAHNGGPVFDKEILYQCHTPEFSVLLDIQRAGYIPQAIRSGKWWSVDDDRLREYVTSAAQIIDGFGDGVVDWDVVSRLREEALEAKEAESEVEVEGLGSMLEPGEKLLQIDPMTAVKVVQRTDKL